MVIPIRAGKPRLLLLRNERDGRIGETDPPQPGATSPPPPPPPAASPPPPPAPPSVVSVSVEEYERLKRQSEQFAAAEKERQERERQAAIDAGRHQEVINQMRAESEAAQKKAREEADRIKAQADADRQRSETMYKTAMHQRDLATALAGHSFASPHAAQQFQTLVAADAEVRDVNGSFVTVRKSDGKPIGEAVAEMLKDPAYAHWLPPKGTAGAGSTGTATSPPPPPPPTTPANEGERLIAQRRERMLSSSSPLAPVIGMEKGAR
jgi:hypothetical protein